MNTSSLVRLPGVDGSARHHSAAAVFTSTVEPLSWPLAAGAILLLSGVLWAIILRLMWHWF